MTTKKEIEERQDDQIDYQNREETNEVNNSTTKKTNVSHFKNEDEST